MLTDDRLIGRVAAPVSQNSCLIREALAWYLALQSDGFVELVEFMEFVEFVEFVEARD
jgi:hypothetical protein